MVTFPTWELWFGDERGYNATLTFKLLLSSKLWFGDERGYNATHRYRKHTASALWFGDERGYNATNTVRDLRNEMLWFGDERGYNATVAEAPPLLTGCGLVMKEDITQPEKAHAQKREVVVW